MNCSCSPRLWTWIHRSGTNLLKEWNVYFRGGLLVGFKKCKGLVYKDFALDAPACPGCASLLCGARAYEARSVHKQPLSNSANPQPAEGFVQEKHRLPEGISDISAGGGAIRDRSRLLQVCMHRYTHKNLYVYRLVKKRLCPGCAGLPWKRQPLARRTGL